MKLRKIVEIIEKSVLWLYTVRLAVQKDTLVYRWIR
jgi:hypothetical protein